MIDSWKISAVTLLVLGILIVAANYVDFSTDGDIPEEGKRTGNTSEYTNQNQEFMRFIKESESVLEDDR